jgi:hypothetical protein
MPERRSFEELVKQQVDSGVEVVTAIGRAIEDDPTAYGEYLKRQKTTNVREGLKMKARAAIERLAVLSSAILIGLTIVLAAL